MPLRAVPDPDAVSFGTDPQSGNILVGDVGQRIDPASRDPFVAEWLPDAAIDPVESFARSDDESVLGAEQCVDRQRAERAGGHVFPRAPVATEQSPRPRRDPDRAAARNDGRHLLPAQLVDHLEPIRVPAIDRGTTVGTGDENRRPVENDLRDQPHLVARQALIRSVSRPPAIQVAVDTPPFGADPHRTVICRSDRSRPVRQRCVRQRHRRPSRTVIDREPFAGGRPETSERVESHRLDRILGKAVAVREHTDLPSCELERIRRRLSPYDGIQNDRHTDQPSQVHSEDFT